jgi:hypothetical protein
MPYSPVASSLSLRLAHPTSRQAALAEIQAAHRETHAMTAAALGISIRTLERLMGADAEVDRLVRKKDRQTA